MYDSPNISDILYHNMVTVCECIYCLGVITSMPLNNKPLTTIAHKLQSMSSCASKNGSELMINGKSNL